MYHVYILYSEPSGKSYVGYTNNVQRRLQEHNFTGSKGFTLRYRPWVLIHIEEFAIKEEPMNEVQLLKIGKGRKEVWKNLENYLSDQKQKPLVIPTAL